MKHDIESYGIIALVAVGAVILVHLFKPMLPASLANYIP